MPDKNVSLCVRLWALLYQLDQIGLSQHVIYDECLLNAHMSDTQ